MQNKDQAFEPVIDIETPEVSRWHALYARLRPFFRKKRMQMFEQRLAPSATTRVLDVGGDHHNWEYIGVLPRVTLANIMRAKVRDPRFEYLELDARRIPLADNAFDIAYSNSVIEHVGDFADQLAFAQEVRRVAPRYFVQTPNKWFPVEPHFFCVGIHWLPPAVFKRVVRYLSLWGWMVKAPPSEIDKHVDSIRLLDIDEMRQLFPDAEIVRERFLLFTKSIVAIKR